MNMFSAGCVPNESGIKPFSRCSTLRLQRTQLCVFFGNGNAARATHSTESTRAPRALERLRKNMRITTIGSEFLSHVHTLSRIAGGKFIMHGKFDCLLVCLSVVCVLLFGAFAAVLYIHFRNG